MAFPFAYFAMPEGAAIVTTIHFLADNTGMLRPCQFRSIEKLGLLA
jgi:hypothetical protein